MESSDILDGSSKTIEGAEAPLSSSLRSSPSSSSSSSAAPTDHALAAQTSTTAGHEVITTHTMVIENFHKHGSFKDLNAFLKKAGVECHKATKVPNRDLAFAVFKDRDKFLHAMEKIEGIEYKGRTLSVFEKTGSAKFERKKRGRDEGGDGDGDGDGDERGRGQKDQKRQRQQTGSKIKTGKEATSPWHDVPYADQLARKQASMNKDALLPLLRGIKKSWRNPRDGKRRFLPPYLAGILEETMGCVEVEPIVESPQQVGYRNKCEFTFGKDKTGLPSLGFRVSSFDEGSVVDPPTDAPTVPAAMRVVVNALIAFVRDSPFSVFDLKTHEGVWRLCTIRYSRRTQDLHVLMTVKLASVNAEMWTAEVGRLAEVLGHLRREVGTDTGDDADAGTGGRGAGAGVGSALVTGCGYQAYDGASVAPTDLPVHSIIGRPTVKEELLGATFEIAPTAFFQVNTPVAERLYSCAIRAMLAEPSNTITDASASAPTGGKATLLLDVCSGTGTIGILAAMAAQSRLNLNSLAGVEAGSEPALAKGAMHVVGIELCDPAVANAVVNAERNGLKAFNAVDESKENTISTTASFVCGRAERALPLLLRGTDTGSEGNSVDQASLPGANVGQLSSWLKPYLRRNRNDAGSSDTVHEEELKVCAVVDPAREGLQQDCLKAIRGLTAIKRLVYISCNPTKSLVRDGGLLCMPDTNNWTGPAFRPVRAYPVDLFPMSPHCELVVIFER